MLSYPNIPSERNDIFTFTAQYFQKLKFTIGGHSLELSGVQDEILEQFSMLRNPLFNRISIGELIFKVCYFSYIVFSKLSKIKIKIYFVNSVCFYVKKNVQVHDSASEGFVLKLIEKFKMQEMSFAVESDDQLER